MMNRRPRELPAVGALALILAITASWWALALWPLPGAAPDWLVQARAVCFGSTRSGLPDAGGWILLIGQPLGMVGLLVIVWGGVLRGGLQRLRRSWAGRVALGGVALLVVVGIAAAGARVAAAAGGDLAVTAGDARAADPVRLDRAAPAISLVDQHREPITVERFHGRPLIVTFAFGHCETVCPLVVRDVLEARRRAAEVTPAVLVVTLDPWRDRPTRLPSIAAHWGLDTGAYVASGEIVEVEAALDRWDVVRARDPRTGDVVHVPVVYLVDRGGRIAYAVSGDAATIAELVGRL